MEVSLIGWASLIIKTTWSLSYQKFVLPEHVLHVSRTMADNTHAHRHHAHRAPSWAVLELRKRLRDNSPLPSKFCNGGSPRSQSLSFVFLMGWIGHHCELNLRPRRASSLFCLLHLPLNSPAQTQEEPPFKQAQQARQVERDRWRLDQVGISALSSPAQADEWPLLQGRDGERRRWGEQRLSSS